MCRCWRPSSAEAGVEFSLEGRRIVDAMRIFHTREPRNLEGAVRFYCGRDIEDAHSAEADTLSSFEVLVGQFKRYPDLPLDLDELDRISRPPEWFDRSGKLIWRTASCASISASTRNAC